MLMSTPLLADAVEMRVLGSCVSAKDTREPGLVIDYQRTTRFSGGRYILSPSLTPKAS
jgi:hypothetical protein